MRFLIVDIRKRVGPTDTPHYAVQRLLDVLSERNITGETCHYDNLDLSVEEGALVIRACGIPLTEYTHIIMRGHRTLYEYMLKQYVAAYAQKHGIRLQNARIIQKLPHYTKTIQMVLLAQAGIPYVDSFYCVDGLYWQKEDALKRIGFPLIYKHTEGGYRIETIKGENKTKKNIFLINTKEELRNACLEWDQPEEQFLTKPSTYFIQKYVPTGEDYRSILIEGRFLSAWKRSATGSFLTVNKGQYALVASPDKDFIDLSERTAQLLEADYCAVDIIYDNGKPHVLEINMNPGFKSFETKLEGNTVDIASAIIDNMLNG